MQEGPHAPESTSRNAYELLDSMLFPAAVLDRAGVIRAVNDAWTRFAMDNSPDGRVPPHTGLGTDYLSICRESVGNGAESAHAVCDGIRTVLDGRAPRFIHQYRCDSPTQERWFYLMVTPRRSAEGGAVVVHVDVTPSHRTEEENLLLRSRIDQGQRLEALGRLASGAAHDFNNMLGVILGYAEIGLASAAHESQLHGDLLQIKRAAERSAVLTRQLLALARRHSAVPRILDLNSSVGESLGMLRRLIGEGVDLRFTPSPGLWMVHVDPQQVDHVLANLCLNARDAIGGAGTVRVALENVTVSAPRAGAHPSAKPGDHVALRVTDDGAGMPPEVLAQIFEPFFTTKGVGRGTGLGLSTVLGMVEQNGGILEVESTPGKGTTVTAFLPRRDGTPAPALAPDAAAPLWLDASVLLVEDEPMLLELVPRMLRDAGCRVHVAGSADEALRIAANPQVAFDLVLTDVVMPVMNGRELVAELERVRPGLRHVYVSGHVGDVIARHGLLDRGTRFLHKPFTREELIAELSRALHAPPA